MRFIVNGQELYLHGDPVVVADGTQNFVQLTFEFDPSWEGNNKVVQLKQSDQTLNVVLPDTNTIYLPPEIHHGMLDILVLGFTDVGDVRATTNAYKQFVEKSGLIDDGSVPIPPTPDLYTALLKRIAEAEANIALINDINVEATTLDYGMPATADVVVSDGQMRIEFGIPSGRPGDRIEDISVVDNKVLITLLDGTKYEAGALEANVVRVQNVSDLPSVGRYNTIYIVSDDRMAYTFNDEPFGYVAIGDVDTMTILDGGSANG